MVAIRCLHCLFKALFMTEHGLFQSIADSIWSRSKVSNSLLKDVCDQWPSLLLVQVRGCQFSIITTNLRICEF